MNFEIIFMLFGIGVMELIADGVDHMNLEWRYVIHMLGMNAEHIS